ncbi:MAG: phosphotransferase [Bacteroidetes bacterium]|nr:phosphotransferase [Bacteroidota bacterium]
MQHIEEEIKSLYKNWQSQEPTRIEKIPQAGSDRMYFVVIGKQNCIATYNINIAENATFIYFSKHFKSLNLNVPQVFCVNQEQTIYLQENVGNKCLLDELEQQGHAENIFELYKKSLQALAKIQILGDENLDYNKCITAKEFGKEAIMSDLLYFKYYFLDTLQYPYDKQQLLNDFEALSNYLNNVEQKYFMFRDFQSRNIMLQGETVNFIDFQGGMKGALQYDVASLLWQAKAQLSNEWKNNLLNYYIEQINTLLPQKVDEKKFKHQYNGYVLIRLLQVLGAYGFRGLFERKAHFLTSIPFGLNNLKEFLINNKLSIETPELEKVLAFITSGKIIEKFTPPQANETTKLKVTVNSFSYKVALPKDETENGGGFVFDMRGILNPGRFDDYKKLSGLDKSVQIFLEQQTQMNKFLNSIWDIIDITVEDYLARDFENLQINFGCTGGQHRSVYAAEQTARHLRNKYKLKVEANHTNKENWKK